MRFKKIRFKNNPDIYIGKLLRYGMLLSCGITVFGGIIYLFQHNGLKVDYSPVPFGEPFGTPENLRAFSSVFEGILRFDGASIIQSGVIVLIATPVLRVAFSILIFLIEKDFLYVIITLIVLLIILSNMFLSV